MPQHQTLSRAGHMKDDGPSGNDARHSLRCTGNDDMNNFPLHAHAQASIETGIGEVPEWSIGAVSKTVVPSRGPRVRIPVSPPFNFRTEINYHNKIKTL
jgi:hypothetical protein